MQLLFTWIEDYHNIKNQGFNFSAEYDIAFDHKSNTLSITKNPNYIPEFFGNIISNITAIVGKNGTGKSSVLSLNYTKFYIAKSNDNFILVCSNRDFADSFIIDNQTGCVLQSKEEYHHSDTFVVKYSNDFYIDIVKTYYPSQFNSTNIVLLTNDTIITRALQCSARDSPDYANSDKDPIIRNLQMILSEIGNQMDFVLNVENRQKLPLNLPEKIVVSFNIDAEIRYVENEKERLQKEETRNKRIYGDGAKIYQEMLSVFLAVHLPKQFKKNSDKTWERIAIDEKAYALFLLRWSIFFGFVNSFSAPNIDYGDPDSWLRFDTSWKTKPIEDWFVFFFEVFVANDDENNTGSKFYAQVKAWSKNVVNFVKNIELLLDSPFVSIHFDNTSFWSHTSHDYTTPKLELYVDISQPENNAICHKLFVQDYSDIIAPPHFRSDSSDFLSFSWRGVSSGEMALLRIYSRLYRIKGIINHYKNVQSPFHNIGLRNNLIILIDEGELGMHPEWQQQFLSKLIIDLPIIFKTMDVTSIQIILSTHSPFVLSDLPNHHVIFLDKDTDGNCVVANRNPLQDRRMTFGANIHSLLADGFFMNDGLMGDFAKQKINALIDDLIENTLLTDERKEEIKKLIPLIGEPIIRKKLNDLYNEKLNLNVENRINDLQRQIDQLKASSK